MSAPAVEDGLLSMVRVPEEVRVMVVKVLAVLVAAA